MLLVYPCTDGPPQVCDLMNQVAAKAKVKWFQVGIQLGINPTTLEVFDTQPQDPMRCYFKVFTEWEREGKRPYTWTTIIGALETAAVNERQVAVELREWLMES